VANVPKLFAVGEEEGVTDGEEEVAEDQWFALKLSHVLLLSVGREQLA
jgi:hypothetical protein